MDEPQKVATRRKKKVERKPRTKQRNVRHIVGDRGVELVQRALPPQWVARPINPDYGLDFHVEVFAPDADDPMSGNTLGEHFYIQIKTSDRIPLKRVTVRSRKNVTKADPDRSKGDPLDIEVVKFSLDTETLLTVETMGAAVPVLLCYVDLSTEKVYYVCLNDYVTKNLVPYKPLYEEKGTVTISIPSWNVLDSTDPSFAYIWLLARRGKYYAAFNTFAYQFHELQLVQVEHPYRPDEASGMVRPAPEMLTMARTFLRTALRLSIWDAAGPGYWAPLGDIEKDLHFFQENLPPSNVAVSEDDFLRYELYLLDAFRRAANLGRMYEELVREWRLPTYLAAYLDYDPVCKYNPPRPLVSEPAAFSDQT